MITTKLNDAPVLEQLDGHWQKVAMLLLWKLVGRDKAVKISSQDIRALEKSFEPGIPIVFTHGMHDGFEFSIVDQAAAQRIAEHEARLRGNA